MKNNKRLKLCITLGLCCLLLGGCMSETDIAKVAGTDEPIPITVWHYYNGKQKESFDDLVNSFNETAGMEKGIVVTAETKGNVDELAAAVIESADEKVGADLLPDIAAVYADTALVLYQKGLLTDISQYMTEEELSAYVPAFLEEGMLADNELHVFPVAKSTELFYLNVTDWESFSGETGITESAFETWEGLAQAAKEYYEWSDGKTFFGRDAFANYLLVGSTQLGKPIFQVENDEVTVQLDEAAMRRLWECYAVPYLKGYYGAFGRFRSDDVKTGDLVACVASTASVAYYPTEVTREDGTTYPIEVKVYDLPDFEGTTPHAVQQGAGMVVIQSDEKKQKAAVEFLKWFTDVEQNTQFSIETGYFPVKIEANSQGNIEANMKAAGITEESLSYDNLLKSSRIVENSSMCVNKAFENGMEARNVLTGHMTDYLNNCLEEMQTLLEEGSTKEEVWESYITEELFQDWLSSIKADLEAIT